MIAEKIIPTWKGSVSILIIFVTLLIAFFTIPASATEIYYGTPFIVYDHASAICAELGRPAPTGTGWVFLMRQSSQGRGGDTYYYENQYPYTFNAAYWPPFYPAYDNYADEWVKCGGNWGPRTGYTHIPIYAQIPPVSIFNADPLSGRAPLTIQFADSSTGSPTTYSWLFGDGAVSYEKYPLHTYLTGGNFTINHSASNTGGTGWSNITAYINVTDRLPLPNIYYGAPFIVTEHASEMCAALKRPAPTGTGWVFIIRQYSQGRQGDTYFYETQYPYTFNAAYWPPFYPQYNNYADELVQCGGNWGPRTGYTGLKIYACPPPIANFTASPLTGSAPLTVNFTDTSTGSPTSWNWSFGDGMNSTEQNPSHIYAAAGTYDVSLTAANAGGSNATVKAGYVTVTAPEQTDFYVYAEGVGMYHGTQDDLSLGNITPGEFYNFINGKCGTVNNEKCWNGRGLNIDDNAGSVHWSSLEQASSYADNADKGNYDIYYDNFACA